MANAIVAHAILTLRHDEMPEAHASPEVNLALMANLREPSPEPEIMALPSAPPAPPLQRNPRIRIFAGADHQAPTSEAAQESES